MVDLSSVRARGLEFREAVRRLHGNETGAEEGMNKLLIFAMVALPLLALLIFFGNEILTFATDMWDKVFGAGAVGSGS